MSQVFEHAPVVITVYNRYDHFRRCIESLKNCRGANNTDLFIAIDAPFREVDVPASQKIKKFAEHLTGFKTVTVLIRETNIGGRANCFNAIEYALQTHDRFIYSEDDNLFAPDFLEFMNEGLEAYEKRSDIHAICGFNYPIIIPAFYKSDIYAWQGFSAWGYATWKEEYERSIVEPPRSELKEYLSSRQNRRKLRNVAGHYPRVLYDIVDTGYYTGDSIVCYHLVRQNKYCIFPTISRVRNIGHDGSGLHSHVENTGKYLKQVISDGLVAAHFEEQIGPNKEINEMLRKHFKEGRVYFLRRLIKNIKRRIRRGNRD